jgi:hypothetical protein
LLDGVGPYLDVAGLLGNDAYMGGEDARDDQRLSASALAEAEQMALVSLYGYLSQVGAFTSDSVAVLAAGVLAVLSAPDRDVLAVIERYPELLTDSGSALFRDAVIFSQQLGVPRVIELVKRRQAEVQAVRETRG